MEAISESRASSSLPSKTDLDILTNVVPASMMRETTVPGVFGAGDVSEVFKAVLSGALGGGIAAAGIVHGFTQAGLGFPA